MRSPACSVAAADAPGPSAVLGPALRSLRVGTFVLVPDTGLIEADETLLSLVGITPADFDGKADTLLAHALPEDMHALVSVLEPAPQAFGRRELEFRVRGPTGEMRWLSLSCRVVVSSDDRPEQVLGGGDTDVRPAPERRRRLPHPVADRRPRRRHDGP